MNLTPQDNKSDPKPPEPQAKPDLEQEELQRQVMAHVREFGPRKYLALYKQAKQLKESGVDPSSVRKSLVLEIPKPGPVPETGIHFISRVHGAKQKAIYHIVRNA